MKNNKELLNFKLLFKYDRGIVLIFSVVMCMISLISWVFGLSSPDNRRLTFVFIFIFGILSYFIFESILLLERLEEKKDGQ